MSASNPASEPSPTDIATVKNYMVRAGNLPTEIVDKIMDEAEYWTCSTITVSYDGGREIYGATQSQDQFLMRTDPIGLASLSLDDHRNQVTRARRVQSEFPLETLQGLAGEPILEHPCRKVVFDISSHDQGSCTYPDAGNWTWFSAGVERFDRASAPAERANGDLEKIPIDAVLDTISAIWPSVGSGGNGYHHDLPPQHGHCIKYNNQADGNTQHHHIEWLWTDDTGFVNNLKLGDIITVWGHARFQGWVNHIEEVTVKVLWAV
jgi:hypothetical protein